MEEHKEHSEHQHKEHSEHEHKTHSEHAHSEHEHKTHSEHAHSEHEHKPHVHKPSGTKINKLNLWKSISGILGILLIISFYLNISGSSPSVESSINLDEAADTAVDYINTNLLQPGTTATLQSKSDRGDLYNVKIDIGGREYDSYVTKDGKLLFPNSVDLTVEVPEAPAAPAAPSVPVDMELLLDDDAVKGDPDAPVTIIEWSEFECPYCARFYNQAYSQIIKEYVDTGKVKIVFRDYPLSFHKNAQKAAEAAECAGDQEKYYAMHDKLFEEGVVGGVDTFKKYAVDLGLDSTEFDNCLDSGKHAEEVAKDMAAGQAAGISGTPGFLINGKLVSGAQPFENFKAIIDAELGE